MEIFTWLKSGLEDSYSFTQSSENAFSDDFTEFKNPAPGIFIYFLEQYYGNQYFLT